MDLEQLVYSLPSTQEFIDAVAHDFGASATIVILPDNLSREMVGRLIRNRAEALGLSIAALFDPQEKPPVMVSAEVMSADWPTPRTRRTVTNLLHIHGLPDVLYVHRIASSDSRAIQQWKTFIEDWAQEAHNLRERGVRGVPALCVIAKLRDFDFDLPNTNAGLSTFWWWGFPSVLEMKLACRLANEKDDFGSKAAQRWRENVIPSLIVGDVQLGERLWDAVTEDAACLMRGLVEYWEGMDQPEFVESIGEVSDLINSENYTPSDSHQLPRNLWPLWADGALAYTPEYGLEVHPALLAYKGQILDVEHMIWRGQSEFLLPMVNDIRLRVCQDMTATYGHDWPTKWRSPGNEYEIEEAKRNPLGTELGHLDQLLRHEGRYSDRHELDEKRHLSNLILRAKNIRNQIAHYNSVAFEDYKKLFDERMSAGI